MFTYGDTAHDLFGIAIYIKVTISAGQSLVDILKIERSLPKQT